MRQVRLNKVKCLLERNLLVLGMGLGEAEGETETKAVLELQGGGVVGSGQSVCQNKFVHFTLTLASGSAWKCGTEMGSES